MRLTLTGAKLWIISKSTLHKLCAVLPLKKAEKTDRIKTMTCGKWLRKSGYLLHVFFLEVQIMKRIKEACICQTLHFMLKEDVGHDYAVKLVKVLWSSGSKSNTIPLRSGHILTDAAKQQQHSVRRKTHPAFALRCFFNKTGEQTAAPFFRTRAVAVSEKRKTNKKKRACIPDNLAVQAHFY